MPETTDDDDRAQALEARVAALETALAELLAERHAAPALVDPVFYRLLEDRYRGGQDLVRERVRPYVTEIQGSRDAMDHPAREDFLVVDLGCGRGELLAALAGAGISAIGVEANREQARAATDAGQRVEITDIFTFLEGRTDRSVDVLSALHLIEHLAFPRQAALLAGAARVLRPGGTLILETPNPENLRVGAWKFHIDPSHLKPLPPELLTLMVEHAGFTDIRVARLHPEPEYDQIAAAGNLPKHAALMLYGPRDYAVLARKPG
jgi:2-polyprenyl-3-methyl-5-hydroxy-6-metoxy-1,4-benzoquinol methylase